MSDNSDSKLINDYKEYMVSLMNSGFDFDTWCEHQYGKPVEGMVVEPRIEFDVMCNYKISINR